MNGPPSPIEGGPLFFPCRTMMGYLRPLGLFPGAVSRLPAASVERPGVKIKLYTKIYPRICGGETGFSHVTGLY